MKDITAGPAQDQRSLPGSADPGDGCPAVMQEPQPVAPIERVIEVARARASDAWAERRGFTARSLEPVVARGNDAAVHVGCPGVQGLSAQEVAGSMRGRHHDHTVYESIEEAALALQDFLFAHQNRLARGRKLGGCATTRPLPVWRLHRGSVDQGSSRRVEIDLDLGETLYLGRGPVPH
ncbi:MAG TPA: hypothetical protein VET24_11105 [Actinomycetota bacterium]|nr:hypothetical protein [Actinomycetota bacterium]